MARRVHLPIPTTTLLSMDQVATLLNVSRRTVQTWVAADDLPVYRFGRRCVRISQDDLATFLNRRNSEQKA